MKFGKIILRIIRSLYCNLRIFPFATALKMPLYVEYNAIISVPRGALVLEAPVRSRMFSVGISGSDGIHTCGRSKILVSPNGKLVLRGEADLAQGCVIRIDGDGVLEIGDHFFANKNCVISTSAHDVIGNDVLFGWNVNVRDSDGHSVYKNGVRTNPNRSFRIGNHVWVASCADILKGSVIPDECVIAYRSCVTKQFTEQHCIIGGQPADILSREIRWER